MKGPIYSRRVKEGGAAVPAVVTRQLSDQGEYPLGLLCHSRCSGTRGALTFVHAGNLVLALSTSNRTLNLVEGLCRFKLRDRMVGATVVQWRRAADRRSFSTVYLC